MNKEEIKVGEYVRTIQGYIAKVTYIDDEFIHADNTIYCDYEESPLMFIEEKMSDGTTFRASDYILKHSPNLIDLIQIEDIVKVKDHDWIRVFNIDDKDTLESFIEDCEENNWTLLSIVTKEAFKSVEYTIMED